MLTITPAEIFGVILNKEIQHLTTMLNLIKNLSFDTKPPYNVFKDIFIHCVQVHKKWNIELLQSHLGNLSEKFNAYIQLLLIANENVDIEYVKEQIYIYTINNLVEEFSTSLHNSSPFQLETIVKKYASQILRTSLAKNQQSPIYSAEEIIQLPNTIATKILPLKLGFDDVLEGGVHNGELLLYIAATAGGKSSFLLRDALTASIYGYRTLYVSLELGEELIGKRLKRLITTLNLQHIPNNLFIKRFPTKGASLDDIFLVVDDLGIDVIVLDYLDLLNYNIGQNNWLDLEALTAYFRGYANERDMIALTASQTNREGLSNNYSNNNKIVGLNSVAYSIGKVFTADYIITITRIDNNESINNSNNNNINNNNSTGVNMIAYLAKNRRGPTWMQPLNVDFNTLDIKPVFAIYIN